jgi:solute carrier family 25 folate transporter 32
MMIRDEGVKSLFKGFGASVLGLVHVALYFPLYENLKLLFEKRRTKMHPSDYFICSIISKFVAASLAYPHVVVRTRYPVTFS